MRRVAVGLFVVIGLASSALVYAWVCCSAQFSAGRLQAGGVAGAATWQYNPAGAPDPFGGAIPPAAFLNAIGNVAPPPIGVTGTWNLDRGSTLAFTRGANTTSSCAANNDTFNTIGWAMLPAGTYARTLIRMGPPPPIGGVSTIAELDICFNQGTSWVAGGAPSVDLESVALHEIGHALGLNHPNANLPNPIPGNGQRTPGDYTHVVMAAFQDAHAVPVIKRNLLCDDKSGATYIYPPLAPAINEFRDYASQNTGGCDFGDAADPFAAVGKYPSRENGEDANGNGVLDMGDSVYRDADGSDTVSAGDVRLSTVGALAPGPVIAGDADVGTVLYGFMGDELHTDGGATMGSYDAGEPIYRDNDGNGSVSAGDTRLLPPAGFGSGTTVSAGDLDAVPPAPLAAFAPTERHDNRISDAAGLFDPSEDFDGDGVLNGGNGARHKDSRMEWLGPILAAAGTTLPKEDEMAPNYRAKNPPLPAPAAVLPWDSSVVAGQKAPNADVGAVPSSATFEPQTRQINLDELDDGVSFRGPLIPGVPVLVDILIDTNGLTTGRYVPTEAARRLFVNGWEDWNGDGDWEDWAPPAAGGAVLIGPGGMPPCTEPAPSDEYVLDWQGSPAVDQFASPNFCGGTPIGAGARVLTFWVTPPITVTGGPFFGRFRLDYSEYVGQNLTDYSDLTLIPSENHALNANSAADRALEIGFEHGEAVYGEVEDYVQEVVEWIFFGIAQGGTVSATIFGVEVTIVTTAGQTAEEVAGAFADAVAGEPLLTELGVTVAVDGSTVYLGGVTSDQISTQIDDPGLLHGPPLYVIPTLTTWGMTVFVMLLAFATLRRLRAGSTGGSP